MSVFRCACVLTAVLAIAAVTVAVPQPPAGKVKPSAEAKLAMSGLQPAKLHDNLCLLKYRVSTASPQCQAYFDQGLGFFYSYVWMEAVRSFETAARHDPDCAMAWWGLSRALEQFHRPHLDALKKAQALLAKASHREQLLIQARLEEKGVIKDSGDTEARKKAAIKSIDTLIALYDDDEEGWFYRAQLSGGAGFFGGQVSSVPFYKALLLINPMHPGGNHELLHFYEKMKRPALGWVHAERYIESSPGIPHAHHMQAHLAMRLGRWEKTTDRSAKAIELQRAYHKDMNVKPAEDRQFAHHLEVLMRGLIHDGRFAEAGKLQKECLADNIKHPQIWFGLHLAERDYESALRLANEERERDKSHGSYQAALVFLKKNDLASAATEVAALEEAKKGESDKQTELRWLEVKGLLLCQQGQPDEGLTLLAKAVERTKSDYTHHKWGNGAYHMQAWGLAALACHKYEIAEEAFLEALAHDAGCFHAALGLRVLCEKLGRNGEAVRYAELAQRCWRKAAAADIARELELLRNQLNANGDQKPAAGQQRLRAKSKVSFVADDPGPLRSGPQVGDRPGPYASVVVTGPNRGMAHCFICETEDKPAVITFARGPSDVLAKLAQGIDKALAQHRNADLRSWMTFLHEDQAKVDDSLVKWSRQHALSALSLGVFEDLGGPPSYKLSRDAEVTVLLSVKQKVVANFAFREGELTEQRVAEVLKAVGELVAK